MTGFGAITRRLRKECGRDYYRARGTGERWRMRHRSLLLWANFWIGPKVACRKTFLSLAKAALNKGGRSFSPYKASNARRDLRDPVDMGPQTMSRFEAGPRRQKAIRRSVEPLSASVKRQEDVGGGGWKWRREEELVEAERKEERMRKYLFCCSKLTSGVSRITFPLSSKVSDFLLSASTTFPCTMLVYT